MTSNGTVMPPGIILVSAKGYIGPKNDPIVSQMKYSNQPSDITCCQLYPGVSISLNQLNKASLVNDPVLW